MFTALHHERIYIAKYIHGNIDINSTALHHYNIRNGGFIHGNTGIKPTTLQHYNIRNGIFIHGNAGIKPTACVVATFTMGICSNENGSPFDAFQAVL